jgi:hypothetical protein
MTGLDTRNKFDYAEDAVLGTATKNTTTDVDYKVTDAQIYVQGGQILFQNAVWGDYITAQVVDKDNVLGYGAGTVLNEYIAKRYIHPDLKKSELEVPYAGEVPQNCYLRIKYTSVGTSTDVDVAINYKLHHDNS